jgi:phenylacetic acid degradation protein
VGHTYSIDGVIPVVDRTAFVHPDAVLIGDVRVGAGCYVGPHASLRGDMGVIDVQEGANIQDGCVLHCFPGQRTLVEPNGHVGHAAVLHGCTVRRDALIGIGAVVMDNAVVGRRAFVGAHSFVSAGTTIRDAWLAIGTPAREVRELTDSELTWKANGTAVYQQLAERSRATLTAVAPLLELGEHPRFLDIDADATRTLQEHRRRERP